MKSATQQLLSTLLASGMLLGGVGCAHFEPPPLRSTAEPSDAELFSPPAKPPGFDPAKATLSFDELPDPPELPEAADSVEPIPLPRQALRRLDEADSLMADNRLTEAVRELERALRYNEEIPRAHAKLAMCYMMLGREDAALRSAQRALEILPATATAHYVLGRLADQKEQSAEAMRRYRLVLASPETKNNWQIHLLAKYHLSRHLEEDGYHRASVELLDDFLKRVSELDSDDPSRLSELATAIDVYLPELYERAGQTHALLGDFDEAADGFAHAARLEPGTKTLRIRQIRSLVLAERDKDAMKAAIAFVKDHPANEDAIDLLVALGRYTQQTETPVELLGEQRARRPSDTDLVLAYAEALIANQQYGEAVEQLEDWDRKDKRWPEVLRRLSLAYRRQGNWTEWLNSLASQLVRDSATLDRVNDEIGRLPIRVARRFVLPDDSVDTGESLTIELPSQPGELAAAYYCLGYMADSLEQVQLAGKLFEQSLQAQPGFVPSVIGAAGAHAERCRWDEALSVLDSVDPQVGPQQNAELERLRGECLVGLDRLDEAAKHYRLAIEHDPDNPASHLDLAQLSDRKGERKQAREQYQAVLERDPNHLLAREHLIRNLWTRWRERGSLPRLTAELSEMQRIAPGHPATIRSLALAQHLVGRSIDLDAYIETMRQLARRWPDDLRTREDLASALLSQDHFGDAIEQLRGILRRDPYHAEANELLGNALWRNLNYESAADHLSRAATYYPNRPTILRLLAETKLVLDRADKAIETWQRLIEQSDPQLASLYRSRLMQTLWLTGRYELAIEIGSRWLEGANEADRDLLRLWLLRSLAKAGRHDQYLELCRTWLGQQMEGVSFLTRAWLLGADSFTGATVPEQGGLIGAERYDEAVLQAMAWLATDPEGQIATVQVLDALRASKRYAEAIEVARSILSATQEPAERIERLEMLMQVQASAGRYDDALATLETLLADPVVQKRIEEQRKEGFATLAFGMGQLIVNMLGQADRFEDAVNQTKQLMRDVDEWDSRLAELEGKGARPQLQRKLAEEREANQDRKAELLRTLSFLYHRQDRHDLAEDRLREAYELKPGDIDLSNDLGYTLADTGKDITEAEAMLFDAVSHVMSGGLGEDSRQSAFLDSYGWVMYKKGEFERAMFWLELARRVEDGDDPVIYDHLGDVYWRLGRREEAIRQWNESLELHDHQVAEGRPEDESLVESIEAKLEAVDAGEEPAIAKLAQTESVSAESTNGTDEEPGQAMTADEEHD